MTIEKVLEKVDECYQQMNEAMPENDFPELIRLYRGLGLALLYKAARAMASADVLETIPCDRAVTEEEIIERVKERGEGLIERFVELL